MEVEIKDMQETLAEIIREARKRPEKWYSLYGVDRELHSEDICIFNPDIGIYKIKKFQKNPWEQLGVGAKIARKVDDDILDMTRKDASTGFGIIRIDLQKLLGSLMRGYEPAELMLGKIKDAGVEIPVTGPMHESDRHIKNIKDIFPDEERKLKSKFAKLLDAEETFKHYG
jgi:hypothetical protein